PFLVCGRIAHNRRDGAAAARQQVIRGRVAGPVSTPPVSVLNHRWRWCFRSPTSGGVRRGCLGWPDVVVGRFGYGAGMTVQPDWRADARDAALALGCAMLVLTDLALAARAGEPPDPISYPIAVVAAMALAV